MCNLQWFKVKLYDASVFALMFTYISCFQLLLCNFVFALPPTAFYCYTFHCLNDIDDKQMAFELYHKQQFKRFFAHRQNEGKQQPTLYTQREKITQTAHTHTLVSCACGWTILFFWASMSNFYDSHQAYKPFTSTAKCITHTPCRQSVCVYVGLAWACKWRVNTQNDEIHRIVNFQNVTYHLVIV